RWSSCCARVRDRSSRGARRRTARENASGPRAVGARLDLRAFRHTAARRGHGSPWPGVLRSGVRSRCALFAALLVGGAGGARDARADDPREAFGLPARPPAAEVSCSDGLALDCAIATDPLDRATPYALSTWLPGSYLRRQPGRQRV